MRTNAIIHLDNFKRNFDSIRLRVGKNTRICVPVKADAYGHGALKIAKAGIEAGACCLGVAAVSEGKKLRKSGIKAPILLFSQPHPDELPELIEADLTPFISDAEFASILNEQAKAQKIKLSVHLKIETGMGRLGCHINESAALARHITSCSSLKLAGTAAHFAVSDSAGLQDIKYTMTQLNRLKSAVDAIKAAGINPGIVHAANSGAVILHPESWLDMVRPGIFLYGYKTAEEKDLPPAYKKKLSKYEPLTAAPVMELRSAVTLIKKIKKGESVSYGRTWTAGQDTYIAILPAGYADGLPRTASNKWQVSINNETYPLAGRITMDQCAVNLGQKHNVKRWDEAVIFGGGSPDAAALAKVANTIPYEITCNISKRVPRVYTK
ncbi:MAG: alanine racemase [Treponema sp.]|nr:alanine racemase [Treponema sp.]